jgi:hypothetical protein
MMAKSGNSLSGLTPNNFCQEWADTTK